MTSPTRPDPPSLPARRPLDRAAVERVLARAVALQATTADAGGELTEQQLIELGQEVGLSPHHLRQALAEELTRVSLPEETQTVGRLFGPAAMSASRVVHGTTAGVLAALDQWMQKEECLQVKRRHADRITWEARRDFFTRIRREWNVGGRGYALSRASEVGATATPVDERRTLVRLDADLSGRRRSGVQWSGLIAGGGLATGAGIAAFLVSLPGSSVVAAGALAALFVAAGAGGAAGVAGAQRGFAQRVQLALEQVLDRLEHGAAPGEAPSLLAMLSSATRRRR